MIAGRYRVVRGLGKGAFGEVYEVYDTFENDTVALKLFTAIPPTGAWAEAQYLRQLADPHILPIRNADLASGVPYLVTEVAVHGSLDKRLAAAGRCSLDVDDVVRWTRHACYGVARAHDLRLLHNDIKPENLFLNGQGEALVGDFGLAALITPPATSVIPPGASPETAAPEVAAGWVTPPPEASFLSDVYSLGATAFYLLASRPPHDFTGVADAAAKMAIVANQSPPRLRDIAPHVPQPVARVVEKAIERRPGDRFPSALELAAALGTLSKPTRKWQRTDEHSGHIACWRGVAAHGGAYLLCLEQGARPSKCVITSVQVGSGRRVTRGCRAALLRTWPRAVRSVMQALG